MSDFDRGYRDPLLAKLEEKNAEIVAAVKLLMLFRMDLAEKDAEIERLKSVNTDFQRECTRRGVRIADLERLLLRAADALAIEIDLQSPAHHVPLIDEL